MLATARFDVSLIAAASVRFAGAAPRTNDGGPWFLKDVDGDGRPDLVFRFRNDELNLGRSDTQAALTGLLKDATPFGGADAIKVPR